MHWDAPLGSRNWKNCCVDRGFVIVVCDLQPSCEQGHHLLKVDHSTFGSFPLKHFKLTMAFDPGHPCAMMLLCVKTQFGLAKGHASGCWRRRSSNNARTEKMGSCHFVCGLFQCGEKAATAEWTCGTP